MSRAKIFYEQRGPRLFDVRKEDDRELLFIVRRYERHPVRTYHSSYNVGENTGIGLEGR
jgi:hypothetical protein